MENSKLWNTRKKIAWLEILAMFMCVATIIIGIILIQKLDRKHTNFDIHISLEIYYVSIRIYSLACFGEVREGCGWF